MNGQSAVQTIPESDLHRISEISPDDQRPYFLIRLRHIHLKSFTGFPLNPFRVLFQYIEQAIRIIISIFIIHNRNLYHLNVKCSDLFPHRILT